ncbi:MAG: hypothetical protein ACREDR_38930, partial [Blastocatellia bacterium]
ARQAGLDARLRVLAQLGAIRVLDRLGRYETVADRLDECKKLVRQVSDPVVAARFFLVNARRYQRLRDESWFQENLALARKFAAKSPESLILGGCADQEGVHIAAQDKNKEALLYLIEGLNARLPTENFEAIQASCFNIGNTLHRMGERHYPEAQAWLELCANISSWMHLGRYEALAEIILAKIAVDLSNTEQYGKWIEAAEEITARTHNATDQIWCHVIRAMDAQRAGNERSSVDHLVRARAIYTAQKENAHRTLDAYLSRKFPEVWNDVVKAESP